MPQISESLIAEMRAALEDMGASKQQMVDIVARECDPLLGAALMRLIIAADQSVEVSRRRPNAPIWGRIRASANTLTTR